MRLLYVIAMYGPEYLGNLIHRELGQYLLAHGHSFDVFSLTSAREQAGRSSDTVEEGLQVHRAVAAGTALTSALNAAARPFFHYDRFGAGWAALARYLTRRPRYDVVMAEGAFPFGAMCALAGIAPNLVVTAAGGDFIDSPTTRYGYGRFRTARVLMRFTFQRAAVVRVTTPLVRERVIALGAPPARLALVPRNIASYCYPPPGVSLAEFRAISRRALDTAQPTMGAQIIAAVGRLLPIKGFDTLIRALPAVNARAGDTRLVLIGPNRADTTLGDYRAHLTNLARELGVADRVIFTGAVPHPDVRGLLAAADVIAVPSVLEGMNKVAVEGAAVGTPAVVTRTAGVAELLSAAGAGEVVEENSPTALADGLIRVLCDPALRARCAANGVSFAQQFSTPRVGQQLLELFHDRLLVRTGPDSS